MVTTLDYIPFLDTIAEEEDDSGNILKTVKLKIDQELSKTDTEKLHPLVSLQFPQKKWKHPLRIPSETEVPSKFKLSQRYTSIKGDSKYSQEEKLKLLTGYTLMRSRCLDIVNRNLPLVQNEWIVNNESWTQLEKSLDDEINTKRKRMQYTTSERKRRCLDFKPVNDFLQNRWNEKVDELISVGVLLSEKELEEAELGDKNHSQV